MAPGVSAALVTTVVALLVAIPAMFGYNYLVNRIRAMIMGLDNYAAELRLDFERWYVDHSVESPSMAAPEPPAAPRAEVSIKKKPRLDVKVLAPAPVVGHEDGGDADAIPSHRIVKREDPVLVEGELPLEPEKVEV